MDTKQFIDKARAVHGDLYDYSKVVYTSSKSKIRIVCKTHGGIDQLPNNHLKGSGCQKCANLKKGNYHRLDTAGFIQRSITAHGDRYVYDRSFYTNNSIKVEVGCHVHGYFLIRPSNHMLGIGCNKCAIELKGNRLRDSTELFIAKASQIHEGKYSYSDVIYVGAKKKVEVTCPVHGPFTVEASAHVVVGSGCPSCCHRYSKPHKEVEDFIEGLNVRFESNTRAIITPRELDIYLPDHNLAIEFNGSYWHSLTASQSYKQREHLNKFTLCLSKGIHLLQIDEHEWRNETKKAIWKSIIQSKLGLHRKISARSTTFKSISLQEATQFLNDNHLQGSTPLMKHFFGLMYQDEIVAVMTFCSHSKRYLNLSRLAFKVGTTIIGGAQKLFKNSLALLPNLPIVSFSSNLYSKGDIYPTLGFIKERDLPPSYQWFFRQRLWNKRLMRHSHLAARLGEGYNPAQSESLNMFRAGGRKLYDAGYQRWLYLRTTKPLE